MTRTHQDPTRRDPLDRLSPEEERIWTLACVWCSRSSGVISAETRWGPRLATVFEGGLTVASDALFLVSALRSGKVSFDEAPTTGPGDNLAFGVCLYAAARRAVGTTLPSAPWSLTESVSRAWLRRFGVGPAAHALLDGLNPARVEVIVGTSAYLDAQSDLAALELIGAARRVAPGRGGEVFDSEDEIEITEVDEIPVPRAPTPTTIVRQVVQDLRRGKGQTALSRAREATAEWPDNGLLQAWCALMEVRAAPPSERAGAYARIQRAVAQDGGDLEVNLIANTLRPLFGRTW